MITTIPYDIISVDWKPEQTELWLYWIHKHCPSASVHLIPDNKPISWCWSGGKIDCFQYDEFKTDRRIYIDTDTVVTRDLGYIFEEMGECGVGASSSIPLYPFGRRNKDKVKRLQQDFNIPNNPIHYSTGMISWRGDIQGHLHTLWMGVMEFPSFKREFRGNRLAEEIAISIALQHEGLLVWDMPLEVHGNICGSKHFGNTKTPAVIHYHKPERLVKFGEKKWLNL